MRGAISRNIPFGPVAFLLTAIGGAGASEGVDDVLKLAKGGVGEEVLIAFVETSGIAYDLTADEIVTLTDAKVPQSVIAAMIRKGAELRAKRAGAKADTDRGAEAGQSTEAKAGEGYGAKAGGAGGARVADGGGVDKSAEPGPPPERVSRTDERSSAGSAVADSASGTDSGDSDMAATTVRITVPEEVTVSFFYESLLPYGSWVRVPCYGWVWQPTVVVADPFWRPYCHRGRWIWTDHGWYWRSYYPWGWAAFHYGRWVWLPTYRWVWVPGTVWAPAWVHWRCSATHFGWAPLPPEADFCVDIGFSFRGSRVSGDFHFGLTERHYTFVPRARFLEVDVAPVVVPQTQVVNIYNSTTIINNTYVYRNKTVVHTGIPKDEVAREIKRKIETVRIAEHEAKPGSFIRPETDEGDRIKVFRPAVFAKVPEEPTKIAERVRTAIRTANPARHAPSTSQPSASWIPSRPAEAGAGGGGSVFPPSAKPATPAQKNPPDAAARIVRPPASGPEPGYRSEPADRPERRPSWLPPEGMGKAGENAGPKAEAVRKATEESRTKAEPGAGTGRGTGPTTGTGEAVRKALEENARRRSTEGYAGEPQGKAAESARGAAGDERKPPDDGRKETGDVNGASGDVRRDGEGIRRKAIEDAIRGRIGERHEAPPQEKTPEGAKKGEVAPSNPWRSTPERRVPESQPRPAEPPVEAAPPAPTPQTPIAPTAPGASSPETERRGGSFVPPADEPSPRKKKSRGGKN
ncbi:MAG: hypothetical protein N3A38_00490 [Planctomycetota bacterium]|nr:hypothetical protein [Planctomycetota bacterium]